MKFAEIFRDGMVLQHGKPIRIYGEGEGTILVVFAGNRRGVTAENGRWCAEFDPMEPGGPYTIYATQNDQHMFIRDVWIGEVILCAGQSNMQVRMAEEVTPKDQYISDPMLRLFVSEWSETAPIKAADGWVKCDAAEVDKWPSISYLLGAELRRELRCAVGIVNCALGTSIIQAWMHEDRYFGSEIELPVEKMHHNIEKPRCEWNVPGRLYHAMFERLIPYSFAAAVWYQGESNTSDAEAEIYDKMLGVMVENWREVLRDDKLPFTIVQLANYTKYPNQAAWAGVQAAQLRAAEWIPALTCVKCADICEDDNIHPPTKWKLAHRIYEDLQAKHAVGLPLKLQLGEVFRDGAVLQHGKPIRIFGEARGTVTVEFAGETRTAEADGRFCVEFAPLPIGGTYLLKASCGAKTVIVRDILIGEVVLFSGQSNIQFRMNEEVTPPSDYVTDDLLRIFVSARPERHEPLTPADGWVKANPANIGHWSALAYLTGLAIRRAKNCPVGVIACSQGASCVQAWIDDRRFTGDLAGLAAHTNSVASYVWNDAGYLYHYMLKKLLPLSLGSVVWYQGESNTRVNEAENYSVTFDLMVRSWREDFADPALPFIVVQLPHYAPRKDDFWPTVQASQMDAPNRNENLWTVVSADLCEDDNIHPPTKWKLAARICEKMLEVHLI